MKDISLSKRNYIEYALMKSSIFKVPDNPKTSQVYNAQLTVLEETGVKVALKKMQTLLKTLLSIQKDLADI